MSACEKCWADAYLRHLCNPSKSQAEHYHELIDERKDKPCSLDEQKGYPRAWPETGCGL